MSLVNVACFIVHSPRLCLHRIAFYAITPVDGKHELYKSKGFEMRPYILQSGRYSKLCNILGQRTAACKCIEEANGCMGFSHGYGEIPDRKYSLKAPLASIPVHRHRGFVEQQHGKLVLGAGAAGPLFQHKASSVISPPALASIRIPYTYGVLRFPHANAALPCSARESPLPQHTTLD